MYIVWGATGMMAMQYNHVLCADHYMGCYHYDVSRHLTKHYNSAKMTVEQCVTYCKDHGHKYAGLQVRILHSISTHKAQEI